ncbi:hypothetical protein AVEN_109279-1 [Araneus ventricosus]|uniref:Uncharacterized protein n=1 Tax=Araneus ventricosus TaxID=182803 RepID=A0A4Y2R0B0_ARAVE|nr:hypothetical protein AVEN_109279-1 [Araneus ventricosus]
MGTWGQSMEQKQSKAKNMKLKKEIRREKITKRAVLSRDHRLFDSIGVKCPVLLGPKLLLQNIWKMKITWEDEVDETTRNEFLKWIKNIAFIENI